MQTLIKKAGGLTKNANEGRSICAEGRRHRNKRENKLFMITTKKIDEFLLLFFIGFLFFVWPIPHTVSIREITLFLLLFFIGILIYKNEFLNIKALNVLRGPLFLYLLFLLWILISSIFISDEFFWSIKEFKSQWIMGSLSLAIGIGIAILANQNLLKPKNIISVIFLALLLHIIFIDVNGIYIFLKKFMHREGFQGLTQATVGIKGLTIGPIDASCLTDLFLIFIYVEAFFRIFFKTEYLPVKNRALAISFLLGLISSYSCGMRNILGIIIIFLITGLFLFYFKKKLHKKEKFLIISFLFIFASVLFLAYKSDRRWQTLNESISIAWDTKTNKAWIDSKQNTFPNLSNSEPINISNYLRIAKFKIGLEQIIQHPLGNGYGRNAYGHSLWKKYGIGRGSVSDSSFVDLAIGTGIIGILLWLITLSCVIWISFSIFKKRYNYFSFILLLITINFMSRMLIDSILRDHLLHLFLFMIGLLSSLMLREKFVNSNNCDLFKIPHSLLLEVHSLHKTRYSSKFISKAEQINVKSLAKNRS